MSPRISEDQKIARDACPHTDLLDDDVASDTGAFEVCGERRHKRICMTCGAVHCCESMEGPDQEHFRKTGHPFIKPHREPYGFLWCYECGKYVE